MIIMPLPCIAHALHTAFAHARLAGMGREPVPVYFNLDYKGLQPGMAVQPIGPNKNSIKKINSCTYEFVHICVMLKNNL
jgi:hypothetical protein